MVLLGTQARFQQDSGYPVPNISGTAALCFNHHQPTAGCGPEVGLRGCRLRSTQCRPSRGDSPCEGCLTGDNRKARPTTSKIPDPTTIGQADSDALERGLIGHRQAGSEDVCVDEHRGEPRDCRVQGWNGPEDGAEISSRWPCAKRDAGGGAWTNPAGSIR